MTTPLTGNEIRKAFIEFFRDKHNSTEVPSSSLVPDNPTVLLTTAGGTISSHCGPHCLGILYFNDGGENK